MRRAGRTTPGLFQGSAGSAWWFLRLHDRGDPFAADACRFAVDTGVHSGVGSICVDCVRWHDGGAPRWPRDPCIRLVKALAERLEAPEVPEQRKPVSLKLWLTRHRPAGTHHRSPVFSAPIVTNRGRIRSGGCFISTWSCSTGCSWKTPRLVVDDEGQGRLASIREARRDLGARRDAPVGPGSGSPSVEAQSPVRRVHAERGPAEAPAGRRNASPRPTGIFCQARTPAACCGPRYPKTTRRPPSLPRPRKRSPLLGGERPRSSERARARAPPRGCRRPRSAKTRTTSPFPSVAILPSRLSATS